MSGLQSYLNEELVVALPGALLLCGNNRHLLTLASRPPHDRCICGGRAVPFLDPLRPFVAAGRRGNAGLMTMTVKKTEGGALLPLTSAATSSKQKLRLPVKKALQQGGS